MKASLSKIRIFFFLSIPFLLFAFVVLMATVWHGREMSFLASIPYSIGDFPFDVVIIIGSFFICFGLEVAIFVWSISAYTRKTAELEELNWSQERAGRLLVRRDLELTKANEQLRELDNRKSEFLSVAAHQLRTPLSGIKWTLSMIVNGEFGAVSPDQKVFLMKSYESNERMINLVDDMLHADRIDSGKYHLNLVRTQVLDLIDNVLYEILPVAAKRGIKIEFSRGTDLFPQANIDQEKMRAVFQNLLDNAIKYSRSGGEVRVSASHDDDTLSFIIKDNGIGIPEDQKPFLFSRFFRARNALKAETNGTGLGLFIVKSIIERHGGKIWFDSGENEGSAFYFTIKI